ncbi:MAG TPA: hypothetical protein VMF30_04375 [Pirellulales bacterium]|nr:hypothetical protein [Pirellulales bacterium]
MTPNINVADPSETPEERSLANALTLEGEARAFWRMRWRMVRHALGQSLATARLRMSLVVFLSVFFWVGLFALFLEAFRFMNISIGHTATYGIIVQTIYSVFFASLMVMLILSAGIIIYSGLYCSAEAAFLLTMPIRAERIVQHKFQEAIAFSSWGFLLLGTPMLVAYGVESRAPWYYFVLLLPFMLTFVYIPGSIGAILCLVLVYRMPRLRQHWLVAIGSTTAIGLLVAAWASLSGGENDLLTPPWFLKVLSRLQFSQYRLLPSWWLSTGLLQAASKNPAPKLDYQPSWAQSLLFLSLLVANALFAHLLTMWTGSRLYRAGYSALHTQHTVRKRHKQFWLDEVLERSLLFLDPPMRYLILKDLRVFRRDPVQWSQFLIFFGLLTLYFVNIHRFSYEVNYIAWVNIISFLNLAVVGLILSTFTTRFIFPMISLEGRRFWILGLLPVKRDAILWSKFLFAAMISLIPCSLLILLSDAMLQITWMVIAVHQLVCVILCVGLSGIAVGLGATIPDLREQSPSKIAAGFGGTLNLVLSAIYILLVVLLTALPCHFFLVWRESSWAATWLAALLLGTLLSLGIGVAATLVPMRMGLAAFRKLET